MCFALLTDGSAADAGVPEREAFYHALQWRVCVRRGVAWRGVARRGVGVEGYSPVQTHHRWESVKIRGLAVQKQSQTSMSAKYVSGWKPSPGQSERGLLLSLLVLLLLLLFVYGGTEQSLCTGP